MSDYQQTKRQVRISIGSQIDPQERKKKIENTVKAQPIKKNMRFG